MKGVFSRAGIRLFAWKSPTKEGTGRKMSRKEQENREIHYDAFISYRHTQPDMFAAQTLHREMEAFRLPKNIKRKQGAGEKDRISRVFRDREELPLTANLADPITEALEKSDFLIVICSPRLPQSLWCRKEIETFMKMHGRDKILAALVEGEPEDAFPEELLYREEEKVQDDGSVITVRVPIEPLAADIRGKSQREIKKKIKAEVLRLAAPMFGCTYDELKQRHRERRLKRIIGTVAAAALVCLCFGLVSTGMALKIHGQNLQITNQSKQIQEQKEQIELQYTESLKVNAALQAEEALRLLEEGDRTAAIAMAGRVLPGKGEEETIPYVAKAEYALSESLGVYLNGSSIVPEFMLKHDTNVDFMKLSPDRKTLLTVDDAREIYLWEVETGSLLSKIDSYTDRMFLSEEEILFLDNQRLAVLYKEEIFVIDLNGQVLASFQPETEKSRLGAKLSGGGESKYFLYLTEEEAQIYSTETLDCLFTLSAQEGKTFIGKAAFDEEKQLAALAEEGEEEPGEVILLDTGTGEIKRRIPLAYENVEKLCFAEDTLYILNNSSYENRKNADGTDSVLFYEAKGRVIACDAETGEEKWHYENGEEALDDISVSQNPENDAVILTAWDKIIGIRGSSGSYMGEMGVGSEIVRLGVIQGSDYFIIYTRSGRMMRVDASTDTVNTIEFVGYFDCNSDNVEVLLNGNGGRVMMKPYLSNAVTVLRGLKGEGYEVFAEGINPRLVEVDTFDHYVLTVSEDSMTLKCLDEEGKEVWKRQAKEAITDIAFFEEGCLKAVMLEGNSVTVFDRYTGEQVCDYTLDESAYDISLKGSVIHVRDGRDYRIYDTLTGELVSSMDLSDIYEWEDEIAVMPQGNYMAVSSVKDKLLRLYRGDTKELLGELPLNTPFISGLFLQYGEDYGIEDAALTMNVYVNYEDNKMERYCFEEGEGFSLQCSYDEFQYQIQEMDGNVMMSSSEAYLFYGDDMTAVIPSCRAVDSYAYTGSLSGNTLYRVPVYTADMLLEEAQRYLTK